MGSGCTTSTKYFQQASIPDAKILYTGDAYPTLGICTNDTLLEVETVILNTLVNYSTGVGITIPDISLTACNLFAPYIECCAGSDSLDFLMQTAYAALCVLYNDIVLLQSEVGSLITGTFDTGCLTGVTSASSVFAIVQELILEYCITQATLASLGSTVTGITDTINSDIGNYIGKNVTTNQSPAEVIVTGSGSSTVVTLQGFVPIGAIIPYAGSMSVFGPTGIGQKGTTAYGFHLCNGQDGAINMSGLVPMGTTDLGGGTPVTGGTTSLPTTFNSIGGEFGHTLKLGELPNIDLSIVDPGHSHQISFTTEGTTPGPFAAVEGTVIPDPISTTTNTTGITVQLPGSDQAHNNIQPYRTLYYIQRMF